MSRLRSKASQFFKNSSSQDEQTSSASTSQEADFNTGVDRSLRKKPSRFLQRQTGKPLPASPVSSYSTSEASLVTSTVDLDTVAEIVSDNAPGAVANEINKALPSTPHSDSQTRIVVDKTSPGIARKARPAELIIKKRPSFASAHKFHSRIFRRDTNHDPPPPPLPQIPTNPPTPQPRRPTLRSLQTTRSARSSRSNTPSPIISRPVSSSQLLRLPSTFNPSMLFFNKPSRPAPPRPYRPDSVDYEIVALQMDGSARMILPIQIRTSTSTVSTSSPRRSSTPTPTDSEGAYSRLGLPSGHSSITSPKSDIFDAPLAANLPTRPDNAFPSDETNERFLCYKSPSPYFKPTEQCKRGRYEDGVDQEDRHLGPIEMYRASKCVDWTLERRISGKLGERGMLFKDRYGGWHFVLDI